MGFISAIDVFVVVVVVVVKFLVGRRVGQFAFLSFRKRSVASQEITMRSRDLRPHTCYNYLAGFPLALISSVLETRGR